MRTALYPCVLTTKATLFLGVAFYRKFTYILSMVARRVSCNTTEFLTRPEPCSWRVFTLQAPDVTSANPVSAHQLADPLRAQCQATLGRPRGADRILWRVFRLALGLCKLRYRLERLYFQSFPGQPPETWHPVTETKRAL